MYGVSAVTTPTDDSTWAASRVMFAVMPSMQLMRRVPQAFVIQAIDCRMEWAITGSKAFSWSWPPSAAAVTVASAPITLNATWLTTSGITGFTLPGMIDDPACTRGKVDLAEAGLRPAGEQPAGRCRSSRA